MLSVTSTTKASDRAKFRKPPPLPPLSAGKLIHLHNLHHVPPHTAVTIIRALEEEQQLLNPPPPLPPPPKKHDNDGEGAKFTLPDYVDSPFEGLYHDVAKKLDEERKRLGFRPPKPKSPRSSRTERRSTFARSHRMSLGNALSSSSGSPLLSPRETKALKALTNSKEHRAVKTMPLMIEDRPIAAPTTSHMLLLSSRTADDETRCLSARNPPKPGGSNVIMRGEELIPYTISSARAFGALPVKPSGVPRPMVLAMSAMTRQRPTTRDAASHQSGLVKTFNFEDL